MSDKGKTLGGSGHGPAPSVLTDTILAETIRKELRYHHLYDEYMLSPSVKKNLVLTNKPTSAISTGEEEDEEYMKKLAQAKLAPRDKYLLPVTSSQDYGWDTEPLVRTTDRRFHFPRFESEITRSYGQVQVNTVKAAAAAVKK